MPSAGGVRVPGGAGMSPQSDSCDHNTIPCRRWFRRGWVCVRCHRWFRDRPERDLMSEPVEWTHFGERAL